MVGYFPSIFIFRKIYYKKSGPFKQVLKGEDV
ncbi:hypothetical protein LMIV_1726 [Listeria monocytogenes FSL J1-208]|nr:hypothetical protein LMIV_1726 [Listeria monocytogenes FSL J1-208]